MGRLLDLLFPSRVHARKQREEAMAQGSVNGEKLDRLRSLIVRTEAVHSKRRKESDELLLKVLSRMDELDRKVDALDKKITDAVAGGTLPGGVFLSQVANEYLYGANGDE